MAWGYIPRRVVKGREASFDEKKRGPGFLLVLVAIFAFLFVFGVVSDILKSQEAKQSQDVLMIFDPEPEEKTELLVDKDQEWNKSENSLDRGYRILWKKTKGGETEQANSIWEQEQRRQKIRENAEEGRNNWDEGSDQDE